MEHKGADHGLPPKLTKNFPVHKWVDLFILHPTQMVGVCNSPLNYVVRVIAAVNATPPVCHVDDPHPKETESIDGNLALTAPMLHKTIHFIKWIMV
jgi:hypothetical protein